MNPFERHNIEHLSPSSLALYRTAPALWCLRYLFRLRDDNETPYAWRGKAVESGIDAIVMEGASNREAIAIAIASFEKHAGGEISPEVSRERNAIPSMVSRASEIFRKLGQPVVRQHRVEVFLDSIEVPIVGYADYVYGRRVIDLKSTFAIPSTPRPDHTIQISFYATALSLLPGLVYTSPRRTACYGENSIDVENACRVMRQSARAVRAMLAATDTAEAAAALFVPTVDYRWSAEALAAAQEVWS